ncbi:MAG: fibronectin type III domain-containing protein [Candidatus Marinimicrobia bacterium]|nr:fibronectin type III domain-containing protein [Candidatus Neomarinimicrobiota bacterium]MBL7022893.1 fibronectin type III domain-containing protein [Candidatus Neomarinimicrobiota bacterium]MBL7109212.1 fibronectin type III domain-containing protein [Candidatus Neomarinimicrobiota bacterium]
MKNKIFVIISIVLLFLSCDLESEITTISNDQDYDPEFQLKLISEDSGLNKYSATVYWNSDEYDDFGKCSLFVRETEMSVVEQQNFWTFPDLTPGEFYTVDCFIFNSGDSIIAQDSIQIFTRPLISVTDFRFTEIQDTSYYFLSWKSSTENETDFRYYSITRYPDEQTDTNFNDITESSFTDMSTLDGIQYEYTIETVDNDGNSRFGIPMITTSQSNVFSQFSASDNNPNHIDLNWSYSTNFQNNFYQVEIWRNDTEDVEDDENESTLLAIIIDPNKTHFEDRFDIGTGKTYYYRIYGIDILGNRYNGDIAQGRTTP